MNRQTMKTHRTFSQHKTAKDKLMLMRPDSSKIKLCDLHVYKVPTDLWRGPFNNILNDAVTETVSVGIIRVPAEIRLVDIREEIVQQLGANPDELVPKDYVFLRSVGRSLTTLRLKQEYQLKAKHFVPPVAYVPELFILEATPEIREALAVSDTSSQSPPLSRQVSPRSYPNTYRPGHGDNERLNRPYPRTTSPSNKYQPLPDIGSDPHREKDTNRVPDEYLYNPRSPSPTAHPPHQHPSNGIHDVYGPYHYHSKNNKTSPKRNKHPETDSEQPGSEWDEQPENKKVNPDKNPYYIKRSPPESEGKGRNRRQDDDSGVAGLSPDDDYHRRNKDEYDNILRRTKDLQKHLDSEKLSLDDETEEERRQRLEDLENRNYMDRQRWDVDQEDRRRRAMEDRLREDERKREKDKEERTKKENDERKQLEEGENKKREEKDRRRKEEEEKKRREDEEKKIREEEEGRREEEKKKQRDEVEKKRKELEKKEQEEAEKRKKEIEKHQRDEEAKKKKEAEEGKRKREEQERRQEDEELKKLKKHIPSPDEMIRDTESARQRRRDEKNQLLKDVDDAREARHNQEKVREELVRKAKQMQHKTTNRRNEARDMWKKKYFEEKKKTAPLEENSNRLQNELEVLHKRLVNTLEGPKEKHMRLVEPRPSEKNNYVIQSTKLQHEIEDLQRRVENARMKLTAEMKLRNQAQGELRALRAELTQRKQSIELNRQQQLASLNHYHKSGKENSSSSENIVTHPEYQKSYYQGL